MCVQILFSSVKVAERSPIVKELLTWLAVCSLCIMCICDCSYFPVWFLSN